MARAVPLPGTRRRRRQRMTVRERREATTFYILILPFILGFLGLTLIPMLASFYVSFTSWDLLSAPTWVGFANFQRLFTADPDFIQGVKVTLSYAVMALPSGLVVSLALAMLMNRETPGVNIFRAIYFLPSLLSG